MIDARILFPGGHTASVVSVAGEQVLVALDNGQRAELPLDSLTRQSDGTYRTSISLDNLVNRPPDSSDSQSRDQHVFLEAEEQLRVDRQEHETGTVRVIRSTETREEIIGETGWQEHIEVERVPVGEYVSDVAPVREQDGITIVPVYEEVLVVERKLLLKEEIHLRKTRQSTQHTEPVTLRKSTVQVERTEPPDATKNP